MKLFYKLIIVFCFLSLHTFGYEYLYIRDPRGWGGGDGTIEEATFTVKPKGAYAEISVYMTFSARGLQFTHNDSLEVEFYFEIDKNSVFTDLWLWIGDDIMKALIMDRWTATNIYENIVKRRKDPALLIKEASGNYRLRIFPMAGDESRKIKMTYLVPADLVNGNISISLPTSLIRRSKTPLQNLKVITYPNQNWKNPFIVGYDKSFTQEIDDEIGEYSYINISKDIKITSLKLNFNSPADNGKIISTFNNGNEKYFQIMIPPSELIDEVVSKKVVFVTDYVPNQARLTPAEILNNIKLTLKEYFNQKDSFNLIFSNQAPQKISSKWLPADINTIATTFASLQNPISTYSNVKASLVSAVDFIRETGYDGQVVLISCSDEFDTFGEASDLINTLKGRMNPLPQINIIDIQYTGWNSYQIAGNYYWGNDYVYSNLARITMGEYIREYYNYNQDGYYMFSALASTLDGFITNFDITSYLSNGFTYGKFTHPDVNQPINVSKPLLQIGKYSGEFSGIIQISGTYNSRVFSKKIEFANNIIECDSTLEQMWAGKHIDLLEKQSYSQELVAEIVHYSISKRILSRYSAFLALEPNDTLKFCATCFDESSLPTVVEEQPESFGDTLKVQAYPNPFNSQTKIVVELPESYSADQLTLKVYDIVGQEVISFDPMEFAGKASLQLTWNGKNNFGESVASGIYLFVVQTPKAVKSLKLLNFK